MQFAFPFFEAINIVDAIQFGQICYFIIKIDDIKGNLENNF